MTSDDNEKTYGIERQIIHDDNKVDGFNVEYDFCLIQTFEPIEISSGFNV